MMPLDTPQSNPNVNTPVSQSDLLENLPFISDPAFERVAFDQSSYLQANSALLGYMEGHRLTVMYFQQYGLDGDNRTNIMDGPNERHIINTAYLRINNFEITLPEAWSFSYDRTIAQATITGTAITYPGFNPLVGDVFLTSQGDNKIALFKVSSVEPLSWRNQRVYRIGYYFYSYPTSTDRDVLISGAVDTYQFDKANFLGGTTSLLTQKNYSSLQTIRQMRDILSTYYVKRFYNPVTGSYGRPDGMYDPYLVTYLANMIPFMLVKIRPIQLVAWSEVTYQGSLWARLDDSNNLVIQDLFKTFHPATYVGKMMDVGLTNIVNNKYILLDSTGYMGGFQFIESGIMGGQGIPYAFSQSFYDGNIPTMSPFEAFLYTAISTRTLTDVDTLIGFINGYQRLDPMSQFYNIPAMLFLIDLAVSSISQVIP